MVESMRGWKFLVRSSVNVFEATIDLLQYMHSDRSKRLLSKKQPADVQSWVLLTISLVMRPQLLVLSINHFLIGRAPTSCLLLNSPVPNLNHSRMHHGHQPGQPCACRSHEIQLRVPEQCPCQKQVCLEVEMPNDTRQHGLSQARTSRSSSK